jgi:hypothetical protein
MASRRTIQVLLAFSIAMAETAGNKNSPQGAVFMRLLILFGTT